ncbi:hypothetical protein R1flu_002547 [Riccia fluitans]|uniref:Cytochrome P450 n=1 Tax=Riccia fluitans TaxID=41844 RepID=A0ABD1Y9D2_9MARC
MESHDHTLLNFGPVLSSAVKEVFQKLYLLSWLYTALASLVLYACVYRWVLHRAFKGPKLWPVIGCTLEVAANRRRMHDWVTEYCQLYYPTWKMRLPHVDIVTSVDPANVEYVLKTNFSNYVKGESQHAILCDTLGDGIFTSDGDLWRRQRKVASYEFASKNLREYSCENFRVHAVSLCKILDQAEKDHKPVDMMNLALRLSLESICKLGFGVDMGSLDPSLPETPFDKSFDGVNRVLADRFVDPFWKLKRFFGLGSEAAMKRYVKEVNSFSQNLVLTRKAELETTQQAKPDLLSRFVGSVDSEPFTSNPLKDLQDVVTNFLIAGRDTTASALMWTLYAISSHPQVEEKVIRELRLLEAAENSKQTAGGAHDTAESSDTLPERSFTDFVQLLDYDTVNQKMHYLHAAISEAMRLYSSIPADVRVAVKDDVLPACGTSIRAGDMFQYSAYSQGRTEQVWGQDCLEYKPERWLKDGVHQQESQFKYPVFHGGPRLCLGKDSALLHLKITLGTLLRFFKLKLVPGHKVAYQVSLTLQMSDDGLKMTVQKRSRETSESD